MYIAVRDVKRHVNVDHDEDNGYLSELIEVAEVALSKLINTDLSDYVTHDAETEQDILEAPLRHAIRLIVGNLYANREPASYAKANTVAFTLSFLVAPYIKLS